MSLALALALALSGAPEPTPAMVAVARAATYAVATAPSLPLTGPAAREGTIAMLVAVAWHESGFRADVVDCRTRGDSGRSVSAWQLHKGMAWAGYSEFEICADPLLAASLALRVISIQAAQCTRSGPGGWLHGYASGSCAKVTRAGAELCRDWLKAIGYAGIEGASCDSRKELF